MNMFKKIIPSSSPQKPSAPKSEVTPAVVDLSGMKLSLDDFKLVRTLGTGALQRTH